MVPIADVPRIPPEEAHAKVSSGQALLVCGYEEPEKFAAMHLEGGIPIQELRKLRPTLPKDREIIFYCA
ncbi:MAG: rhodanese-like domain-containing protein [Deferrisomatales bacterium]|nr:rhodanese-like domain-containing protein [Deferrisomatales bacterium]